MRSSQNQYLDTLEITFFHFSRNSNIRKLLFINLPRINKFLKRTSSKKTKNYNMSFLPITKWSVLGLQVLCRIPVWIKNYNPISTDQIQTQTASTSGYQEYLCEEGNINISWKCTFTWTILFKNYLFTWTFVEVINKWLTYAHWSWTIKPGKAVAFPYKKLLQYVQHPAFSINIRCRVSQNHNRKSRMLMIWNPRKEQSLQT